MPIPQTLYTQLQSLYAEISDICSSIFIGGSEGYGVIRNPHDIDLIFCVPSYREKQIVREKIKQLSLTDGSDKRIHTMIMTKSHWNDLESGANNKLQLLVFNHTEALFGTDDPKDYQIDIFKHKQRYLDVMRLGLGIINLGYHNEGHVRKYLYRILMFIYFYQNNSYDLTEEQIDNINVVHDGDDTEKCVELLEWANSEFLKL